MTRMSIVGQPSPSPCEVLALASLEGRRPRCSTWAVHPSRRALRAPQDDSLKVSPGEAVTRPIARRAFPQPSHLLRMPVTDRAQMQAGLGLGVAYTVQGYPTGT